MTKKLILNLLLITLFCSTMLGQTTIYKDILTLKVDSNTFWWTGIIDHGSQMPLTKSYTVDFNQNNYTNQVQPLLLSNQGEVIWSEQPFAINFTPGKLRLSQKSAVFQYTKAGQNLKDAYHFASKTYFPPSGKMPSTLLFTNPQYNTWIELGYNQNQNDVLKYARGIIANNMPTGVLMIDAGWQEDNGNWIFHAGRFPNPKQMIDSLHTLGFKVMLWMCPFVSPDSKIFRDLMDKKYLLTDNNGYPSMVGWWDGTSAELDLTNPNAVKWFKTQLDYLTNEYKVDGFKFDAGDYNFYIGVNSYKSKATPSDHAEAWAKIGLDYPLNEYRAMWKMGGQALGERLNDKPHGFVALQQLIPNMIQEGLMGYYFSCPDMVGGGFASSFTNKALFDQESIVRSAQCHALMPMMQFSVAPWRVLDKDHFEAVKQAITIREKFKNYFLELAQNAAVTGEPILKPLEFNYPNQGYSSVIDQFLLGDKVLVAPVLTKSANNRTVVLPKGEWRSFNGKTYKGPAKIVIPVSLSDLPYFELIK
ncbi:MAG: glycoside hydrolase family 31 protein [Paludibacter sp.]